MLHIQSLRQEIDDLIAKVQAGMEHHRAAWTDWHIRPDFADSVDNLAAYLALRQHDLRILQRQLMALGLSSLGRLESRVLPVLQAVRAALAALDGDHDVALIGPDEGRFYAGETCLLTRTQAMFGVPTTARQVALMVTCPSQAAYEPGFMWEIANHHVEAIRINCAHDGPEEWAMMIEHVRAVERVTGRCIKIFMDLAGPKIRTGDHRVLHDHKRVFPGDRIAIVPTGGLTRKFDKHIDFAVECSLAEGLAATSVGHRLFIDDGKIALIVGEVQDDLIVAMVTRCKAEGVRLKSEKGINFPDSELSISALTAKDRADLNFVADHADGISFSFVQSTQDIVQLQEALTELRPDNWRDIALVLKIETAQAVRNLPDMVVRAGADQPVAIMIARGDLAIEIGFTRMAEMQEEILWIGEAAQVPVIWATQVMEQLVKEGLPSRGELTDAAMAGRAECVMLNKGPFLFDAVTELGSGPIKLPSVMGLVRDEMRGKTISA